MRGIHRWPVNSPHKGQRRRALMFSFTCAWINGWVNNREAGDLSRHRAHYDAIVMNFVRANTNRVCSIIFVISCSSNIWYLYEWNIIIDVKNNIVKYLCLSLTCSHWIQMCIHDVPSKHVPCSKLNIVKISVRLRRVKLRNYWHNIINCKCLFACYKEALKKHILSTLHFGSCHLALMKW